MTPLTTLIFDFHEVVSSLMTSTTIIITPSLERTNMLPGYFALRAFESPGLIPALSAIYCPSTYDRYGAFVVIGQMLQRRL